MSIQSLIANEGWKIVTQNNEFFVKTQYDDLLGLIPVKHPGLIHLEIYGKHTDSELKFQHMKKGHDYLWPNNLWHSWTERRFRAHCEGWNYITLAGGANIAKSRDAAYIGACFYWANPKERNVTVASVTLASLLGRVWGYVTDAITSSAVKLSYTYTEGNSPKLLYKDPLRKKEQGEITKDTLHGIFAVTAQVGDDYKTISTWIGKHPKDKLLVILDEATDMPMSILSARANLNAKPKNFQMMSIGNSNSTLDLHGVLSTPENGWDSVTPELIEWKTTQKNGICLYFSPYESPAIHDPDPQRREDLAAFLPTLQDIEDKKFEYGEDSEDFWRMGMGFWKSKNTENLVVSTGFLKDFNPRLKVEWSGYYPVKRVAGLDPAFSTDGDKCILRIANVGHAMDLKVKIDFMQDQLLFEIKIKAIVDRSVEIQIADQVIDLLALYNVPLDMLAIDVTGQGRAIGEVIRLRNSERGYPLGYGMPLKIYSMAQHNLKKVKRDGVADISTMSTHMLWNCIREFTEQGQICGLDDRTIYQLTNRLIVESGVNKSKRLESKREYKRRTSAIGQGHSPDEADATALVLQVVRQRMGIEPGAVWSIPDSSQWKHEQEKLIGYRQLEGVGKNSAIVPVADFSGGLENYMNFKRGF